jgi:DNA primase catalytic subunit
MNVLNHYKKVKDEIFEFCKNRWVALYGKTMIRYKDNFPLYLSSPNDLLAYLLKFNARTVYATAAKYEKINKENVENDKIISYTPFFDIDTKIEKWEYAIKAVEIIVSALEKEKVYKSVYLLWSGEGIHVRINENAIPKKFNPLIASHAIVQYILNKVKDEIKKLCEESKVLKVEDLIDSKRVFTVPLSFHKELNLVAVCFSPNNLNKFSIDWAKPENFRHEEKIFNVFEENEAEELVLKALKEYKPEHENLKVEEKKERIIKGKIGRFQVMGLLQAARHFVLYKDLEKAESFGINRAIFYAWAKHYGKGYISKARERKMYLELLGKEVQEKGKKLERVAGEDVFVDEKSGFYIIGEKPQTPEDYEREIKEKIDGTVPYEKAWEAAIKYVSSFPQNVLENQQKFFKEVYLPVRDKFLELMEEMEKKKEKKSENEKTGLKKFLNHKS